MANTIITATVMRECRALYDPAAGPSAGLDDKIKSIKHLRTFLKANGAWSIKYDAAAKDLIEKDFDQPTLDKHGCTTEDETAGYHVDMIFKLSGQIAEHHAALKKLGVNIG